MRSALATGRRVQVRVPATSANLGPGFDTLGLALALYDDLTVTVRDAPGATVDVRGVGAGEVPTDETNLVVTAIAHTFAAFDQPMPGLDLVAENRIPHGRGLGSSGAAIVSGIMAAPGPPRRHGRDRRRRAPPPRHRDGGHPDNVAPALFGGLTIAWVDGQGPQHKKLAVHRGVSPLVLVPVATMSTALARSLQPESVPHEDALFNVSRSALLIAALIQSPELLLAATEDRLHQDYRAAAMPETNELVHLLRERGYAAVVSGAGPSLLVLGSDPGQRLTAAELVAERSTNPWTALMLAVDVKGSTVQVVDEGSAPAA